MYWYGDSGNGWGYVVMIISMIAFWSLLITGAVLVVRHVGRPGRTDGAAKANRTPEELLAERFARGEIDGPEYGDRLATLHGQMTAPALR